MLLQKRANEFDLRLNLGAEQALERGEPVEFGSAASVDREVADELRLGVMGVGELGTSKQLSLTGAHFLGPIARYEIEHMRGGDIELEAGYLFALGEARHETDGLVRFMLEYGVHF